MLNYSTTEEKAAEWNISLSHIQYLCRNGKIEGAVKRAGAWFIPDDAAVPIKNTKSGSEGFRFVGTKSRIFHNAIELFRLRGFNEVSLRDIADSVGVRQSTIYNHFKSKQEILDTIYDFYCYHFLKDRPGLEEMSLRIQDAGLMEIMGCIRYDFNDDYRQTMSDITQIIFQRVPIDERAREISKSLIVDDGIRYVEAVFDMCVENGRLAAFDTHSMAIFINSVRIFTLYNWIVDPSPANLAQLSGDEHALYEYAAGFLTDLKFPAPAG